MATAAPEPFRLADELPPQEWLAVLLTELLERKVDQSRCGIPFVTTTAEVRMRLEQWPERFQRSMDKVAANVAGALDSAEIDAGELGSTLCEKAKAALLERCPPTPEPPPEPAEVKTELEPAKEPDDLAFARAKQAQEATLRQEGHKVLERFAQSKAGGISGKDGGLLATGWLVELTADPPKYKKGARPRGKAVAVAQKRQRARESDDEPDDEEQYQAEIAAELEADDFSGSEAEPDAAPAEKGKRRLGAKARLTALLGLHLRYRSQATIAAEKAKLAAFLAAKYGTEGSRTARAMAEQQAGGDANDDDEVQMLGEQTWQERDAAAREAAVEIDD